MAITKSAKKALRQNISRKKRNIIRKKNLKSVLKQAQGLIAQKKIKEAKEMLPQIYKTLDKSAKTKIIKKNTASRKKSRITKAINKEN